MNDDVGPELDGTQQVGAGDRVVDDQRNARLVRNVSDCFDVEDVLLRVGD